MKKAGSKYLGSDVNLNQIWVNLLGYIALNMKYNSIWKSPLIYQLNFWIVNLLSTIDSIYNYNKLKIKLDIIII